MWLDNELLRAALTLITNLSSFNVPSTNEYENEQRPLSKFFPTDYSPHHQPIFSSELSSSSSSSVRWPFPIRNQVQYDIPSTSDPFEVTLPVQKDPILEAHHCQYMLVKEHLFGNSFGQPFETEYNPDSLNCSFAYPDSWNHRHEEHGVRYQNESHAKNPESKSLNPNVCTESKSSKQMYQIIMDFEASVAGRQFDRYGAVWINGTEIYRFTTAEPNPSGITWKVEKDISEYIHLFESSNAKKTSIPVVVALDNLVNDIYTGIFKVSINLTFYYHMGVCSGFQCIGDNERDKNLIFPLRKTPFERPPDVIFPISALAVESADKNYRYKGGAIGQNLQNRDHPHIHGSDENKYGWFIMEKDSIDVDVDLTNLFKNVLKMKMKEGTKGTIEYSIPVEKVFLEVFASPHGCEEFWYGNPPNNFVNSSDVCAGGPFRELQVFIDDELTGVDWPYVSIYTGGFNPLLWRPISAIGSFDVPKYIMDVTPFLNKLVKTPSFKLTFKVLPESNSFWLFSANLMFWKNVNESPSIFPLETRVNLSLVPSSRFESSIHNTKAREPKKGDNGSFILFPYDIHRSFEVSAIFKTWGTDDSFIVYSHKKSLIYKNLLGFSEDSSKQYFELDYSAHESTIVEVIGSRNLRNLTLKNLSLYDDRQIIRKQTFKRRQLLKANVTFTSYDASNQHLKHRNSSLRRHQKDLVVFSPSSVGYFKIDVSMVHKLIKDFWVEKVSNKHDHPKASLRSYRKTRSDTEICPSHKRYTQFHSFMKTNQVAQGDFISNGGGFASTVQTFNYSDQWSNGKYDKNQVFQSYDLPRKRCYHRFVSASGRKLRTDRERTNC